MKRGKEGAGKLEIKYLLASKPGSYCAFGKGRLSETIDSFFLASFKKPMVLSSSRHSNKRKPDSDRFDLTRYFLKTTACYYSPESIQK